MHERAMDALLTEQEEALGEVWLDSIAFLRDENPLETVAWRIERDRDPITSIGDFATLIVTGLERSLIGAYDAEDSWIESELAKAEKRFAKKQRAVDDWVDANELDLIREITAEQREVIARVLNDGVAAGRNPRVIARDIRGSIGLTAYQESHVASYRRALETGDLRNALGRELRDARSDAALRRALEDGTAIDPKRIDAMVERYRANYIAHRGSVIARTEALRTVHEGTEGALRDSIVAGRVDADTLVRQWNSAHDGRVRGSHASMDGQRRPFGMAFVSGDGFWLRYPGDRSAPASETVHCRCVISTRIVPALVA